MGAVNPAGVKDVVVESAMTTIQDCEDSVAAVDADDKCVRLWQLVGFDEGHLGRGDGKRGASRVVRKLNADRTYTASSGGELILQGRSLMLVRNVGHLMTTDAVSRR